MSTTGVQIRREERLPAEAQVIVSREGLKEPRVLRTRDVSPSGAFVYCDLETCPPVGDSVSLKVGTQVLRGRVAHVSQLKNAPGLKVEGFGVGFLASHPQWWMRALSIPTVHAPGSKTPADAKSSELAKGLFTAGLSLFQSMSYGLAQQKFEQAYRASQDSQHLAMMIVCRGYQYLVTAFWDQARETFRRALEISPTCREAQVGLEELDRKIRERPG